jgi:hypothetical protein
VKATTLLEQEELLASDGLAMWATLAPEFGLADLVDGVGEVVLDVETVEDKVSLRGSSQMALM